MEESISFLGLTVYPYGLCLSAATLLALALAGILGAKRKLPTGTVRVFALLGVPLGLFCARLLYCLVNFSSFINTWERPALMLNFFDGGLSMPGLLTGLALAAWLCARVAKTRFWTLADVLAAPIALFIAIARWAERFTELGVGKVVEPGAMGESLPWLFLMQRSGKNIEYRMLVSNYEAIVAFVIFAALVILFFVRANRFAGGELALLFLALYGSTQVVLESLRNDGHMLIIFLRVGQLLAALMPILATCVLLKRCKGWRSRRQTALSWVVIALCVVVLIFLEFSLDGRVTVGSASMLRDYLIMLATCAALCAVPCSLIHTLTKRESCRGEAA